MPDGPPQPPLPAQQILDRQKAAFTRDGSPDLARRRADLKRLKAAIKRHRDRLIAAAEEDFGRRPREETLLVELGPTVQSINHMRRHLRGWMRPERRPVGLSMWPGAARVIHQPLGVVGILSPWNYPFALGLVPLATALAAGNRAILKPSELAPASAEALRAMLSESFEETEIAVVTGGVEVSVAVSQLPFDHLFFTGSTDVGRKVMGAAAATLTPVTLELGGKSPAVLLEDCDIARAAGDIAFGKTANAGQICVSPDYVLLPESKMREFSAAWLAAVRQSFPGGLADPNLTTIINARHVARLQELRQEAELAGAEIVEALPPTNDATHPRALAPAMILRATDGMKVMQEEIFGPLLPVIPYADLGAAIDGINARPHPLALYVYGKDRQAVARVVARTQSGNVTVNGAMLHYAVESLPFGGVGDSGIGAYHGIEGFRRLSHARGIYRTGRWNASVFARPPYGRISRLVARYLML